MMNNVAVKKFTEVLSVENGSFDGLTLTTISTLSTGKVERYKVLNGYYYNEKTPDDLIRVLDRIAKNKIRCRFFLGDIVSGRDWTEEYDTMGTIGRSCGEVKIPLLITTSRSYGGTSLLTHCIVKVVASKGGQVLWEHPKYQKPVYDIKNRGEAGFNEDLDEKYVSSAYRIEDGKESNCANFYNVQQAQGYVAFMTGKTNRKAGIYVVS